MTLSQEFKVLKGIAPQAVIKCVFGNIEGYKNAREQATYKEYLDAITEMMAITKKK